jgi:hypothetical protein
LKKGEFGRGGAPNYDQMHMVGHEAVRNYCKPPAGRRLQKLQQHKGDDGRIGEVTGAPARADRKEIRPKAAVRVSIQAIRSAHA